MTAEPYTTGWRTVTDDGGHTIHVHPLGDLIEHDLTGSECACGPVLNRFDHPTGGDGWEVVHESLDRREDREPDSGR